MEPLSLTADATATLILSKDLEKGGEQLGEAISDKIGKLVNLIPYIFFCRIRDV